MTLRSVNPSNPNDIVNEFISASREKVDAAVSRAKQSFEDWRAETALTRGAALRRISTDLDAASEQIAELIVREIGKPITEARAEVARVVAIWNYYADMILAPDGETYPASAENQWLIARRFPLGVCGLITPWNFPIAIPTWKLAPAIGFGNTAVLKPAPQATATAEALVEVVNRHLPDGVVEMVLGDAETGEAMADNPDLAAISFTGSVPVGRVVAERVARRGGRAQCEMGGQNPSIVLPNADLDRAARTLAYASMGYAGQKCTATSRIIVHDAVYQEMRDRLVAAIEELVVLNPQDETCLVGPVISEESRRSALEVLAQSQGDVLTGGRSLDNHAFYMSPTLMEVRDASSRLAREEVFAPVAVLMRASSIESAIALANAVPYGLVSAIFTSDIRSAINFAERIETGLVRVNAPTSGVDFHAPFGGTKASSIGPREQGPAARDFYTETKTILIEI